ncbi:hypothetical protein B0T21DRAFT_414554 [Apiosordaria backusii]|uniref:Uncharacterized protein n=1 Tax=Apiosordaria backusii TaxID=314023 RepID=A0AA40ASS7_9PEZI|nr:hypothetical protein B0T21DRAFT_414554 [Apiosordaria backusii]
MDNDNIFNWSHICTQLAPKPDSTGEFLDSSVRTTTKDLIHELSVLKKVPLDILLRDCNVMLEKTPKTIWITTPAMVATRIRFFGIALHEIQKLLKEEAALEESFDIIPSRLEIIEAELEWDVGAHGDVGDFKTVEKPVSL